MPSAVPLNFALAEAFMPSRKRSSGDLAFNAARTLVANTLQIVRDKGLWVRPAKSVKACIDPDDDIFLECAEAAQADYLVTGNIRHFAALWAGSRIVTPRWLLDSLLAEKSDPER